MSMFGFADALTISKVVIFFFFFFFNIVFLSVKCITSSLLYPEVKC